MVVDKNRLKAEGLKFGRVLQSVFRLASMFSVDHRAVDSAVRQSYEALNALVKQVQQFTFGFIDHRVLLNNILTPDRTLRNLESEFSKRGIGAVTFPAGITLGGFRRFLGTICDTPENIEANGGIRRYYERNKIEGVRIIAGVKGASSMEETVLEGDPDLMSKIRAAREDGKRVEGHAAGASYERLVGLAAAGFTSCHEAVTAQEARDRLRAGLVTMLRHSSIRPDLPELLTAITRDDIEAGRVMLTADGPTPAFISEHGYLDYLLAVAIHSGLAPLDALRMVTLNPAQYYGFRDVGEIAVGKRADLNVLPDLHHPTPSLVLADGTVVAKDQRLTAPLPTPSWDQLRPSVTLPQGVFDLLAAPRGAPEGLRMVNDVITEAVPPGEVPPDALHVALLDRGGRWITQTKLVGFAEKLGGLATTISSGFDVLVLGQNPTDMSDALMRLARMGGGLVVVEGGRDVFSLPLELAAFSLRPWGEVADANRRFNALLHERGYPFADPIFTLLFLTFDSLPWIRLTSRGLWDVRYRRVLAPAQSI